MALRDLVHIVRGGRPLFGLQLEADDFVGTAIHPDHIRSTEPLVIRPRGVETEIFAEMTYSFLFLEGGRPLFGLQLEADDFVGTAIHPDHIRSTEIIGFELKTEK